MHLRPKHQGGYCGGTLRSMTAPAVEMRVGKESYFPNFPRICTEEKLAEEPYMLLYVMGPSRADRREADQGGSRGRDFLLQDGHQPSVGRLRRTVAAASLRAVQRCGKWQAKARYALGRA